MAVKNLDGHLHPGQPSPSSANHSTLDPRVPHPNLLVEQLHPQSHYIRLPRTNPQIRHAKPLLRLGRAGGFQDNWLTLLLEATKCWRQRRNTI